MKLLGIQETGVTSLFLAGSPSGGPGMFYAAAKLAERYQFRKLPTPQELDTDKNVFEHGVFKDRPINSFEIYSDGVIVRSRVPSDVIDGFIDDVVEWMGEIGLQRVETHQVNKSYHSELGLEFNPKVFAIFDKLKPVMSSIVSEIAKATGQRVPPYQPAGLLLHTDQSQIAGMKPGPFRLERRFSTEFSKNIFFSAAPLTTDAHVRVLEQLEGLLS
jgi:hypothetical protein